MKIVVMDTKVIDTIKLVLGNMPEIIFAHTEGIVMAVIIIIVISAIIALVMVFRYKKFIEWLLSHFGDLKYSYSDRSKKENRLAYLEKCMDKLIKRNMVLNKIEDSYELVDCYAEINNNEERSYC